MFGSNRHMFLNLFGSFLNTALFNSTNYITVGESNKDIISIGTDKGLANGIKHLKRMTIKGAMSGPTRLSSVSSSEKINGTNLSKMLRSVSSNKVTAISELISAICYDQVVAANLNAGI